MREKFEKFCDKNTMKNDPLPEKICTPVIFDALLLKNTENISCEN